MKTEYVELIQDRLENAIAHMLFVPKSIRDMEMGTNEESIKRKGGYREYVPRFGFPPYVIGAPLVLTDDERLFTENTELLNSTVSDLIGDRTEILMEKEYGAGLLFIRRSKNMAEFRNLHGARPNDAIYYELRWTDILRSGGIQTDVHPVMWSPSRNKAYPLYLNKNHLGASNYSKKQALHELHLILAASIQEDSQLFWNIEVGESGKVRTYADKPKLLQLFDLREGPSIGNRRKAILHWVKSHPKKSSCGEDIEIEKYLRGCTEFSIDGVSFKITSPTKKVQ